MVDLSVNIGSLALKNPVLTASGTFGYGTEFSDFFDVGQLGGVVVKGLTLNHREGNPHPRMAETSSGMLNAVGLQNKGLEHFISVIYPRIKDLGTNIIVNVSGSTLDEYVTVAKQLNNLANIPAIEVNISCPNVKEGGMVFGTHYVMAATVTKAVRQVYDKCLIVKLSPNVTDITEIALAVEDAGADSISLINTLLGMAIDIQTRKPKLSTITGGLSGPCIKPVALRMVWQVAKKVQIPIIGIGGILTAADAIEFLLAGASAVQVGTANFIDPMVSLKIVEGIKGYMISKAISNVSELVNSMV